MDDVSIIIPTIPGRERNLAKAVGSIPVGRLDHLYIGRDSAGEGPARKRNQLVRESASHCPGKPTEWVAFLDDDDEFKPGHLEKCVAHAGETGADIVYPWFDLNVGGTLRNVLGDELLRINGQTAFGQEFSADALRQNNFIPVTALVRRSAFEAVGGFPAPGTEEWPHPDCEDWGLWLRLMQAGYTFSHLPERTWTWYWHERNTSGRPENAARMYGESR